MNNSSLPSWAPVVLRYAMAGVFFYFGISQLTQPDMWLSLIPDWATNLSSMTASTIVMMNGIFEVIMASLLILGLLVRPVALLLAAHLFVIAFELGFNPLGIRDFGLAFATLAVGIQGNDRWCFKKKNLT